MKATVGSETGAAEGAKMEEGGAVEDVAVVLEQWVVEL